VSIDHAILRLRPPLSKDDLVTRDNGADSEAAENGLADGRRHPGKPTGGPAGCRELG